MEKQVVVFLHNQKGLKAKVVRGKTILVTKTCQGEVIERRVVHSMESQEKACLEKGNR